MKMISASLAVSFGCFVLIYCYPRPQDVEYVPGITLHNESSAKIQYDACQKTCNSSCAASGYLFGICHYNELCYCIDQEALEAPEYFEESDENSTTIEVIANDTKATDSDESTTIEVIANDTKAIDEPILINNTNTNTTK